MSGAIHARDFVWRGHVALAGLWLPPPDEGAARRRVLSCWAPGSHLVAVAGGYALLLPAPHRRVAATSCGGVPLVLCGDSWAGLPLDEEERKALAPPAGSLVLALGGEVQIFPPDLQAPVDPADWLDLDDLEISEATSLGAGAPGPSHPSEERPTLKDALEGAPTPSAAQLEIVEALRQGRTGEPTHAPRLGLFALAASAWRGLWRALRSVAGDAPDAPSARAPSSVPLLGWLRTLVTRWIARSALMRMLGRRQLEYLEDTVDMLESGNFEQGLRHAVPLTRETYDALQRPLLGVPTARQDLSIRHRQGVSTSVSFGRSLYERMRSVYRRAFERLDALGQIDEAAFTLAELLDAPLEAVAYLERKGRLIEAARVADVKELAPALRVRQWLIASDWRRAVHIAMRFGAFAAAIALLERSRRELATQLREKWAVALAATGEYAAAVEALWPDKGLRARALPWIEQLVDFGGRVGARMLARRLGLCATREDAEPVGQQVAALLAEADQDDAPARRAAFAEALVLESPAPWVAAAARRAWRSVIDAAPLVSEQTSHKLVQLSGDGALRADAVVPQASRALEPIAAAVTQHSASLRDVGATPLHDAAWLDGGQALVALGEGGVRLLTAGGRVRRHFNAPADRLVVADSGTAALALARRDDVWSVSRLDLASGRVSPWTSVQLGVFSATYDGWLWCVGLGCAGFVVDTTADDFRSVWAVSDLPGPLVRIARDPMRVTWLVWAGEQSGLEAWRYVWPDLTLRERAGVDWIPPAVPALSPEGHVVLAACVAEGLRLSRADGTPSSRILPATDGSALADILYLDSWTAVILRHAAGSTVHLTAGRDFAPCLRVDWEGSQGVRARLQGGTLVLTDERGRLLVWDLSRARPAADWRV